LFSIAKIWPWLMIMMKSIEVIEGECTDGTNLNIFISIGDSMLGHAFLDCLKHRLDQ